MTTRLHIFLIGALLPTAVAACNEAARPALGPLPVNVVMEEESEVEDWVSLTGCMWSVATVEVRPRGSATRWLASDTTGLPHGPELPQELLAFYGHPHSQIETRRRS
jgi:hypothetical protein